MRLLFHYIGGPYAVAGLIQDGDCRAATIDGPHFQEPLKHTEEPGRALDLKPDHNYAAVRAGREAPDIREIQIARHDHATFFLSGSKDRAVGSPRLRAIQRMSYIVTSTVKKLLDFDGEVLIDEKPHLNGFLQVGRVRKDLFTGQGCRVFKSGPDVLLCQGRIRSQDLLDRHPVSNAIHDDRDHHTGAFDTRFPVTNVGINCDSIEHNVSITDRSDGQQCCRVERDQKTTGKVVVIK